ncbi:MAG: transporter substrate-binding domain-containing protein [Bacteroidales bacterium]|nr:transporter substrate-binding domain-containing protein [Bacteroidales bacterium]
MISAFISPKNNLSHGLNILLNISIFTGILIFATISHAFGDTGQNQETPGRILVGCEPDYPPYCFINENGKADGFSVELFQEAANEMGLKVDFKTGPWNKLKYDLAEEKLDALPLVGRTPERENMYDFTFPYLTMHGTIVVRENDTSIRSPDDLQGKEVAVMKGDNAEEFLRRVDLNTNIIQRTTFKRAMTELSDGKHDAVVIQRLLALELIRENGFNNLRVVEGASDIYRQSFCFAVTEGDEELLSLLNEGLSIVTTAGTYRQLHAKWFAPLESVASSEKRIIIGGDKNYPPYEFLDENGQPSGYNVELMRAIADEVNLSIEFRLGPWAEIRQELDNGNIDAIQGILYSPQRDETFDMSPAHTTISYVITARKHSQLPENLSELKGKSVLVQKGDIMHDHALQQGLEDELIIVETQEEALRLLSKGKYDFALTSRVLTNYFKQKNGWDNLTTSSKPVHSAGYCIGVKEGNSALLTKLSDGLAAIKGTGKYREIYSQWLSVYEEPEFGLRDFLKYSLYILLPLTLILVGSLVWSRTLNKRVINRTRELREEIKEREKSDKKLKESERKYRELFTSIRDAILVADTKRKIIDCNPAFTDLLGYTLEEVKGKETVYVYDSEQEFNDMGEALRNHQGNARDFLYTIHYRKKDGTVFPGETNVFYLQDEDGNISGFIGLIRDITSRIEAREALKESKETAERYLNIAAEIILSLDTKGNITLLNDSGHRLLGYEKGELIGKNWFDVCLPEDAQAEVKELFDKLMQGEPEGQKLVEGPVLTKTGERKTILWHNSLLRNKNQEITGVLTSGEDITERKKMEIKLEERENFISALLDNLSVGVVACDASGMLTYFNKKTQEFHGLPQMNLPPANWSEYYDLFMPDGETRMSPEELPLKRAFKGEYFNEVEMVIKPNNKKPLYILASGQPLKDNQGNITGAVVAMYDITDRKKAEEQLMELNKTLKERNEEIAAQNEEYETLNEELNEKNEELKRINQELEEAKEKAEESDQLKSSFLANMSHEIRTPMNGIMGFADLLKQPQLSGERKDYYIELIQKSGERMLNIIGNLLDIAKIESGQMETQLEEVSVNEIMDDLFSMFEPEAKKKDLSLTSYKELSQNKDLVLTDATKLNQILSNLLTNAIKYTNKGRITFGYTQQDKNLRFYVSDTGEGISPELQKKIFERFRRADLEIASKYEGAGLGLSISKAYAEMLGGDMWVNSTPGEGSIFYFTIPYRRPEQDDGGTDQDNQNKREKLPENVTLLVAEDDKTSFILLEEMLSEKNINCIPAGNGREALDKVKSNPGIDLVLMDIKMPFMDGYQATREIKNINPEIPVIALTAFASKLDREKALNAGCDEYLAKPVESSKLIELIDDFLKR